MREHLKLALLAIIAALLVVIAVRPAGDGAGALDTTTVEAHLAQIEADLQYIRGYACVEAARATEATPPSPQTLFEKCWETLQ